MEPVLKRLALIVGVLLLAASMIFSFEGFNFNFTATGALEVIFWIIGITLTLSVTVIQMIFNTDYRRLNLTLKLFGVMSYVYSIYTNFKGLDPFVSVGGSNTTTAIIAVFLDAVPEPLIAWALGDSLKGDLIGNTFQWIFGWTTRPLNPSNQGQNNPQPQGQQFKKSQQGQRPNNEHRQHFDTPMFSKLPKKGQPISYQRKDDE